MTKGIQNLQQVTILPAVLLAMLLPVVIAGCGDDGSTNPGATTPAEPIVVEVTVAEISKVPFSTQASGSVEAIRGVSPGTKILGKVDLVVVGEGDRVSRGQLLARLESRDLEAALAQADAAVQMAKAQEENARDQLVRMQGLHARGSVTDKTFEDSATASRVAISALAQAEANLAAARVRLGYSKIVSPLAGWVVAKRIEAGDLAVPGVPLFTLEDLSRVKVVVNVPEAEVQGLEEGGLAQVEILDRRLAATIDRVMPAGDPASRSFSVQLVLDNPDGVLKSGMFARVSFERGEHQVLGVTPSAVITRGQLEGLFVVEDGRALLRWIKTGRLSPGQIEVLSGLEAGERYVVTPPASLGDGAPVEVAP